MVINPQALERVKALVEAADFSPGVKEIYLEAAVADPALLRRTGATEAAEKIVQIGAAYMLDEHGELRDDHFGFTPQTADALVKSAKKRKLVASFTTGADLFKQLREAKDNTADLRTLCEAAPVIIRKQYITAVSRVFTEGEKAKKILQQMVNHATGIGDTEQEQDHSTPSNMRGRWSAKDIIPHGISYIAKALELKPLKPEERYPNPHPALYALEHFIRSLPSERFEVDPPLARVTTPKTLEEKLATPLSDAKQAEADALKDMLFGKGWREKEQASRLPAIR